MLNTTKKQLKVNYIFKGQQILIIPEGGNQLKSHSMKCFALIGVVLFLGMVVSPSVNAGVVKDTIKKRVEERNKIIVKGLSNLKDTPTSLPVNISFPVIRIILAILLSILSIIPIIMGLGILAIGSPFAAILYFLFENIDWQLIPIIKWFWSFGFFTSFIFFIVFFFLGMGLISVAGSMLTLAFVLIMDIIAKIIELLISNSNTSLNVGSAIKCKSIS